MLWKIMTENTKEGCSVQSLRMDGAESDVKKWG